MTANTPNSASDMNEIVQSLKAGGNEFAVATVVRTVSVTAAKPGAKAIINADGIILEGWIGGGCAKGAVIKAARESIADGQPRLVSIQPEELLNEQGLSAGDESNGVLVASNMCPSKGSMEVFVEPVLSNPELLVIGASPVAKMLVQLAPLFDLNVCVVGDEFKAETELAIHHRYESSQNVPAQHPHRYIVVATQGAGDIAALTAGIELEARHLAFVGSRRKLQFLTDKLAQEGHTPEQLACIKGPAGLDIGGVTPQEIALSILAELIQVRRRKWKQL